MFAFSHFSHMVFFVFFPRVFINFMEQDLIFKAAFRGICAVWIEDLCDNACGWENLAVNPQWSLPFC